MDAAAPIVITTTTMITEGQSARNFVCSRSKDNVEALLKLVPLTQELLIYLAMDVAIALVLLMIMKWLTGAFRKYSVTEELLSLIHI